MHSDTDLLRGFLKKIKIKFGTAKKIDEIEYVYIKYVIYPGHMSYIVLSVAIFLSFVSPPISLHLFAFK